MKPAGPPTLLLAAALLCAACQPEERVVRYKPFFSGLEGTQSQTPPVNINAGILDPTAVPGGRIVVENADGSKTLISRNGRHLMAHIQRTLADGEEEQFTQQVLSKASADEFRQRGYDPAEAFRYLSQPQAQREIALLFNRMPMGERSPTVVMDKIGPKVYRVKLTGKPAEGLRWRGFDMIMEDGNWRLRWFIE